MTDRELLELAAKAAGCTDFNLIEDKWNPLTDDADAMRLGLKLKLKIRLDMCADISGDLSKDNDLEVYSCGAFAAERAATLRRAAMVRRAIVKAAAEIGKGME